MTAPPLTVAMSVYNDEPFVGAAIDSILNQSFGDFEFLIVDDHSTDDSARVIREYAARDARIRVLEPGAKGRVPALNRLLAEARAPWFALMDSDDLCLPERFAREMEFLADNPDHGVISCNCAIIDEHGNELPRTPIDRPLTHEAILANLEDGPLLNHNAVIMSREAVLKAGGYRAPFRFAQDYDLWLRLSQVTRMANLPDILMSYRVYPGQVSTRHLYGQTLSAAVAWLSHRVRIEGRPDPVDALATLPPLGSLDALFGIEGADAYARRRIVNRILFAPEVLAGDGYDALLGHIREAGANPALWRVVPRLLRAGHVAKAARAAAALAAA